MDRRVSNANRLNCKGFSLIEILVVVGIIAVLVGFLLPSLARSKRSTYIGMCASNQKQLWQACLGYAATYQGALPRWGDNDDAGKFNTGRGDTANFTDTFAMQYFGNPYPFNGSVSANWKHDVNDDWMFRNFGHLYPAKFIGGGNEGKIVYCPSQEQPDHVFDTYNADGDFPTLNDDNLINTSYFYSPIRRTDDLDEMVIEQLELVPSNGVMSMDIMTAPGPDEKGVDYNAHWKEQGWNTLRGDGSVRFNTPKDWGGWIEKLNDAYTAGGGHHRIRWDEFQDLLDEIERQFD